MQVQVGDAEVVQGVRSEALRLGVCGRGSERIAGGEEPHRSEGFLEMRGQCQQSWSSWRTPGLERCRVGSCWRGGPDLEEEDLEAFSLRVREEVEEGSGPSSSEEEDGPGPLWNVSFVFPFSPLLPFFFFFFSFVRRFYGEKEHCDTSL